MDTTRLTKVYRKTRHRMLPRWEWTIACGHIGIYPYPIPKKEGHPITLDNGMTAYRLDEDGGSDSGGERMWCFYTEPVEYCFALALVPHVSDSLSGHVSDLSGHISGRRFLLYNCNLYQTLLFGEDIADAAALVRTMVRFAGIIKGAENCPIEIHDTTRFFPTGSRSWISYDVLSFMTTGATWYGGLLPGLLPARKSRLSNEPPFYCERDHRVYSILDDVDGFNAKRAAIIAGPMEELHRKWNSNNHSYFSYHGGGYHNDVSKYVGTGFQPLTEWWVLPAAAVRAFCAVPARSRRTRKMRRG